MPTGWRARLEAVLAAFPDLSADEASRLARQATAKRWSADRESRWLASLDAVSLCRRLDFEGWDELTRVEDRSGVVVTGPLGAWALALAAVGRYFRPLVPSFGDLPDLTRRALEPWRSALAGDAEPPDEGWSAAVVDPYVHPGSAEDSLPILGLRWDPRSFLTCHPPRSNAVLIPVFARATRQGGQITVHPPIAYRNEEGLRELLTVIAGEARTTPSHWRFRAAGA